jgi:hypothetical protein
MSCALRTLPARRPSPDTSSQPWIFRTVNQNKLLSIKTYPVCNVASGVTGNRKQIDTASLRSKTIASASGAQLLPRHQATIIL